MTADAEPDLRAKLDLVAGEVDALLDRLLAASPAADETARPPRLLDAMRHAALSPGKRLRPFLVVETAAMFAVPRARAVTVGAALECLHAYSLVHDDLPAMDDAATRRGRPSVHAAFDEATAILAGDALLTLAFDILAREDVHPGADVRIALVAALARAAGIGGMAGGQMLDLVAEGRFSGAKEGFHESDIRQMQSMKTGALLRFACRAGGILAEASTAEIESLDRYGMAIGEAFQIADDMLDREGDPSALGKATGKDDAAGKATLVSVLGAAAARERLAALVIAANDALAPFAARAAMLKSAARFIAERRT